MAPQNSRGRGTMVAFLAGATSGTCSTLLFQPLDLVKTRMQIHALALRSAPAPAVCGCLWVEQFLSERDLIYNLKEPLSRLCLPPTEQHLAILECWQHSIPWLEKRTLVHSGKALLLYVMHTVALLLVKWPYSLSSLCCAGNAEVCSRYWGLLCHHPLPQVANRVR